MKKFFFIKVILPVLLFSTVSKCVYCQEMIVKEGDDWQYYDDEAAPPKEWKKLSALSGNWKIGASPLGYGDDRINTVISFGDDPRNKHITKYFKKTFRIENPYKHLIYKLNVQRDDGIVIYLNGHEILRNNMPEGEINNTTKASSLIISDFNEEFFHTKLLSPDELITGVNTISASVHQTRSSSSDCLFNLELIGVDNAEMLPILLKELTIKNLNLNIEVKEINHKLELEKKDLRFEFLEQSYKNVKTTIYIISALFFISTFFLYYVWKTSINKERKFSEKILELKELGYSKDREMMNISLNSLYNQQYLKEIKRELEGNFKGDEQSIKTAVKKIISQIEYNLNHDDDWENLKKHFNAVHSGFCNKLVKIHPSLSDVELRHCIFIKLHMHTKEIATILHIDPRSVQTSRYRIKKKMNINEGTELRDYLLKL